MERLSLVWNDIKKIEVFLVSLLTVWGVVATLLPEIGVPVKIVSIIAAFITIVALVLQQAVTADETGGLPTFLVGLTSVWSVIAANLTQVDVPVRVITAGGAAIALVALIVQKTAMTASARKLPSITHVKL